MEQKVKELANKINNLKQIYLGINAFKENYHDIKEANTKNADKYFHAKANCQASQYGKTGLKVPQSRTKN